MKSLPKIFSNLRCGDILQFFPQLNICVRQLNTHIKIIDLSTGVSHKVDLKYTRSMCVSTKYKKLIIMEFGTSKKGTYIAIVDLGDRSYKKVLVQNFLNENCSLHASDNEEYIIVINSDGYIYKIDIKKFATTVIMDLNTYNIKECVNPYHNRFYITEKWISLKNDTFETYITRGYLDEKHSENDKYGRLMLDVNNKTLLYMPHETYTKTGYISACNPFCCVKSNMWVFLSQNLNNFTYDEAFNSTIEELGYATEKLGSKQLEKLNHELSCIKGNDYNISIFCEFQKDGRYLFHFETLIVYNSSVGLSVHEFGTGFAIINLVEILYLVDLNNHTYKILKLSNKIKDVFICEEKGYIITVFMQGGAEVFTADDFS